MRVLWRCEEIMMTSPPRPPSPPEGPPRGTNFSRRKAMQPLPPSPAFTRILASSMNMGKTEIRDQGSEIRVQRSVWPRVRAGLNLLCRLFSLPDWAYYRWQLHFWDFEALESGEFSRSGALVLAEIGLGIYMGAMRRVKGYALFHRVCHARVGDGCGWGRAERCAAGAACRAAGLRGSAGWGTGSWRHG